MKIWRVRYSVENYPGCHDEYYLDMRQAIREGLEFEGVGPGAQALVKELNTAAPEPQTPAYRFEHLSEAPIG